MVTAQDNQIPAGQPRLTRQLRAFVRDRDAPTGTLELLYMQTPAVPWPLSWPLAIDAQGRRVALQQLELKSGLRHVNVVHVGTGTVEITTPGEAWAYDPFDQAATAMVAARRAAFSPDDQRLVSADIRPACPSAMQISQAGMLMRVPICKQLASTMEVWSVASGRRIAEASFETAPGSLPTESPPDASGSDTGGMPLPMLFALWTSALGMIDAGIITQTRLYSDPRRGADQSALVTERINLDTSWLTDRACARLPADSRLIQREDWLHDLPGEVYRPICK
jgi:hypothetical protein